MLRAAYTQSLVRPVGGVASLHHFDPWVRLLGKAAMRVDVMTTVHSQLFDYQCF